MACVCSFYSGGGASLLVVTLVVELWNVVSVPQNSSVTVLDSKSRA